MWVAGPRRRSLNAWVDWMRRSKVRGYRIEPGEIETVANEVRGVQRCIVATTGSSAQDVRLVLYAAVPDNSAAVMATLRDSLRKRLPEYMIPQSVIRVAAIPLLPNGKVDLRALHALSPEPGEAHRQLHRPGRSRSWRCTACGANYCIWIRLGESRISSRSADTHSWRCAW